MAGYSFRDQQVEASQANSQSSKAQGSVATSSIPSETATSSVLSTKAVVVLGLAFNLYWAVAVLGQSQWVVALVIMLVTAWVLFPGSACFSLLLGGIGIGMDFLLIQAGVLAFDAGGMPLWLVLLWLGFASFVWIMRSRLLVMPYWLLGLIGSLGGAMSYLAGYRFDAVSWPYGIGLSGLVLLLCWGLFTFVAIGLLTTVNRLFGGRYAKPFRF